LGILHYVGGSNISKPALPVTIRRYEVEAAMDSVVLDISPV